jgi:hypothetical protein
MGKNLIISLTLITTDDTIRKNVLGLGIIFPVIFDYIYIYISI